MTMAEKVARSLHGEYFDSCTPAQQQFYLGQARDAIAALREPTRSMIEDGGDASNTNIGSFEDAENVWRAMIDAALKD